MFCIYQESQIDPGPPAPFWVPRGGVGGEGGSRPLQELSAPRGGGTGPVPPPRPREPALQRSYCLFASPTLSAVTRGLKEGTEAAPVPAGSAGPSCPSRPPTEPGPRGSQAPTAPTRRAAAQGQGCTGSGRGAAPLPGTRGRCRPAVVAMVTAGGGVGLRKGRGVPRGAEAASAPAPAPCGSGIGESGPRGAQDGGGGGAPSSAEVGR